MKRVLLCACALLALVGSVAKAQSGEMRKAMLDYQLTVDRANDLLAAMGPMTKHVMSLPNAGETIRAYQSLPLAERVARTEKDAQAMAILGRASPYGTRLHHRRSDTSGGIDCSGAGQGGRRRVTRQPGVC